MKSFVKFVCFVATAFLAFAATKLTLEIMDSSAKKYYTVDKEL